ncbi:YccF domain-containing protein [uncultured Campylobacter sp.]|uniref:YccF domain-containing protein n=1 Tax=uncultured Campylobacter sp. TaxID=218934 RepID=UPI00262ADC8A|nr:YccF domain-containing protein [uncultured Campylobacter sp.]
MRILGNIIWFFMAGWILAILTYLSGLILNRFSRTAPAGLGLMEYGKSLFLSFTYDMARKNKSSLAVAAESLQNCEYDAMSQKVSVATIIATVCIVAIALPAVAIAEPGLTTRDDAEISKLATNLITVKYDLDAYYISQGKFASDFSVMTNVPLEPNGANSAYLKSTKGDKCFLISVDGEKKTISIAKGPDAENNICRGAYELPGVPKMLSEPIQVKSY